MVFIPFEMTPVFLVLVGMVASLFIILGLLSGAHDSVFLNIFVSFWGQTFVRIISLAPIRDAYFMFIFHLSPTADKQIVMSSWLRTRIVEE